MTKIEKSFGRGEERLSKNEALVFQDYATKKDGIDFSKKAEDESYLEAEKLLEQLKNEKFDWLGIQWDKVDLKDINQLQEMEERLSEVANQLLDSQSENALPEEIKGVKGKGLVLSMTLSVSILLSLVNLGLTNNISAGELSQSAQKAESIQGTTNNPIMGKIEVNYTNSDLLIEKRATEALDLLVSFYGDKESYSRAKDALALTDLTNVSPRDAFKYYNSLKSFAGQGYKIEAIVDLMNGSNVEKSLFHLAGVRITEGNFEYKNGVYRVKDYLEKDFSLLMTNKKGEIKIGIDGPGNSDWGVTSGGLGILQPNELMTAQSLRDAKVAVREMSEKLENN